MNTHKEGYDSAQAQRQEDDLNRWRFAAEIVDVILATPPDWSARIGVFGKWGEGKSTVLRFAERMIREKDNIVFAFNPWAIQDWDNLWEDFGERLHEALSIAGIPIDSSWKKVARSSSEWLQKGVGQIAGGAAALLGGDKLYEAAFGVLSRWLRYDGAQISAIRDKLGDRRLVVVIDDLDRCAPDLIPQLLLSLRELLDLPGFTFLLAFDDEIVARALAVKNPAWSEGSNFLEKILDFRFHLPPVTQAQKTSLISRSIKQYCDFVPQESTNKIHDLLPSNPRKLKALVRSLAALRPHLSRHDPDELNWVDMWLAQMLRLESYSFFERLLTGDTLDKETVGHPFAKRLSSTIPQPGEKQDENQSLKDLVKASGVNDKELTERLIQLVEAIRSRSSIKFRYTCELAVRPHAVTWKEFRSICAIWGVNRRPEILAEWINRHAADRAISVEDVEAEFFTAMIDARNELLSQAAEAVSLEEHELSFQEGY